MPVLQHKDRLDTVTHVSPGKVRVFANVKFGLHKQSDGIIVTDDASYMYDVN